MSYLLYSVDWISAASVELPHIDATEKSFHKVHRIYEKIFNHTEVSWLADVYHVLYPESEICHVPMIPEQFHEVTILGERFLSRRARGNHSSAICAYWPAVGGGVSPVCDQLRELVLYRTILDTLFSLTVVLSNLLQLIFLQRPLTSFSDRYRVHPQENWFHSRILVISSDMLMNGPAVFFPLVEYLVPVQLFLTKPSLIMEIMTSLFQQYFHRKCMFEFSLFSIHLCTTIIMVIQPYSVCRMYNQSQVYIVEYSRVYNII